MKKIKFKEPDYSKTAYCSRHGGNAKDISKPYIFMFPKCKKPREIRISIMTYAGYIGNNGHYYVSIKEESNPVWTISNFYENKPEYCWQIPWKDWEIEEMKGRNFDGHFDNNINIALKEINSILTKWKVLKNKKFKIIWNNEDCYVNRPDSYRKKFNALLKGD